MKRTFMPSLAALLFGALWALAFSVAPAEALTPVGGGLYFQNAQPFSWWVTSASFADVDNLWVTVKSDSRPQLAHSPDKGDTWQYVPLDLHEDAKLSHLTFTDRTHGRATATWYDDHSSMHRIALVSSNDGGLTWSVRAIKTQSFKLLGSAFVSADVTFILGREYNPATKAWQARLLATSNGGATWKRTKVGCPYPYDLAAVDARHLWLHDSDTGRIWTSADAGASWSVHALPLAGIGGSTYSVDTLQALSTSVAFAKVVRETRPHHLVMRTSDGGKTWRKFATYPNSAATGLFAVSGREVWLSVSTDSMMRDTSCYVEHTTDGGATWKRTYVGPRSLGVTAVGPDGTLYSMGPGIARSTDKGVHWARLVADNYEYWFNDVCAAGGGLWAAGWTTPSSPGIYGAYDGEAGLLYRCSDGVTWKQQEIPSGSVLSSVDFSDANSGWIAGLEGRVLHTSDGGTSWGDCSTDPKLDILDIKAISADSAVAIAGDVNSGGRKLLLTSDLGATWSEIWTGTRNDVLSRICLVAPGHVLVAGTRYGAPRQALLLESTNSGASWSERLLPCLRRVRDMTFTDAAHGWILASEGDWEHFFNRENYGTLLLRTTDGGATWTTVDVGKVSRRGNYAFAFGDDQHGWLFGEKALKTTDGGSTWRDSGALLPGSAMGDGYVEPIIRSAVAFGSNLWAVGADQLILSTVDTAKDTAPPLTSDDGDRLWHNRAVTTHLFAADAGGCGVATTEYRVDGGGWLTYSGGVVVNAPSNHAADGDHAIEYRSTDKADNTEFTELCTVHIDTRRPTILAGVTVRIRRGSRAKLPFQVGEKAPNGGTATVTIAIRNSANKVVKRLRLTQQRVNTSRIASFRCRLSVGTYRYTVRATDAAGNRQSSVATGVLVVRRR